LDNVTLGYAIYNTTTDEEKVLTVENSSNKIVGEMVDVTISVKDQLDYLDDWNGTVSLSLHQSTNMDQTSQCVSLPATVTLQHGTVTLQAPAVCAGTFIIKATDTSDSSNTANGNVLTIIANNNGGDTTDDTSNDDTDEPVCGNGILEEGEECDGSVGTLTCADFLEYVSGNLSCNDTCQLDRTDCIAVPVEAEEIYNDVETPSETSEVVNGNNEEAEPVKDFVANKVIFLSALALELIGTLTSMSTGGVLFGLIFDLPILILRGLLLLANLIGIRKRGENIGYVYNATTKEPI
jgi:hypothetical protein